ncbi:mitochondrial inner membrane protease ATP23 homolog isoform X3 [Oryctolagus cuniculus]|uniref:mitochondrial inner membrane protease ATP23 homolog isoform X3 n=1 Tax=Oryctolagus cuniculus TaxID=9986 RepID=UPI00387A1E1D
MVCKPRHREVRKLAQSRRVRKGFLAACFTAKPTLLPTALPQPRAAWRVGPARTGLRALRAGVVPGWEGAGSGSLAGEAEGACAVRAGPGLIVLCQNNIRSEAHMSRVVTHELIHAFDHCRAHVHWFSNVRHLACSEVRAANLSGDCSLVNELFRLRFGLKQHHQTCVRDRAILSILAVRNISKEVAQKAVAEVFESCFNDLEPFGRIPHNKTYARYAHRDFQNRDRYYSNI